MSALFKEGAKKRSCLKGGVPIVLSSQYRTDLKEIFHFAGPIFIEQLAITFMSTFISFITSNISAAAVSGVNIVEGLNFLIQEFFLSIQVGAVVVVAQFCGKSNREDAEEAARQAIVLTLGAAVLVSVAMGLFYRPIINGLLHGAEADVLAAGRLYFVCAIISFPFLAVYSICTGIIRGSGHPSKSLNSTIATNLIFVAMGSIFVFVFQMGIMGIGLALILARAVGAVIGVFLLKKGTETLKLEKFFPSKWRWDIQKPILRIAIPACVENVIFTGGRLVTQTYTVGMGTTSMAANAIADTLGGVYSVAGNTAVLTAIPIIGRYLGMENPARAKQMSKSITKSITLVLVASSAVLFIFGRSVVGLFTPDIEIQNHVLSILRPYCFVCPLIWQFAFVYPSYLRAAGDATFTTGVAVLSMLVMRVFLGYILSIVLEMGVMGIWLSMYADWLLRAAFYLVRYLRGKWLKIRLI